MKTRLPEGLFRFTWQVDQLGYDLKYRHREPEPGRRALILGEIVGWHLVRKGGPLREYWPLDDHPGLFRQFANLPEDLSPEDQSTEPKDLLAFANEFGLLGHMSGTFMPQSEPPDSESLHIWDRNARLGTAFKTLLWQYRTLFGLGNLNRKRGYRPPKLSDVLNRWRDEKRLAKFYPLPD